MTLLLLARPHVLRDCRGIRGTLSISQIQMERNNSISQNSAQRRANAYLEIYTCRSEKISSCHKCKKKMMTKILSSCHRCKQGQR